MLELPEATTVASQMGKTLAGKTVTKVVAAASPHKFAFFSGEPESYPGLLEGRTITGAEAFGGFVRLAVGDTMLLLGDGINSRYVAPDEPLPEKHQLVLKLDDGCALVASVQMYGGMWAFPVAAGFDSIYYNVAQQKPSPLTPAFSKAYFAAMLAESKPTLSAKAFLATEQRIPGLGNGTLQDILFRARLNPKTKINALSAAQAEALYCETVSTLNEMCEKGGRDTEKDFFGKPGGYATIMNSKSAGKPCPVCGTPIVKQAYLGGSVYFCPVCQPI